MFELLAAQEVGFPVQMNIKEVTIRHENAAVDASWQTAGAALASGQKAADKAVSMTTEILHQIAAIEVTFDVDVDANGIMNAPALEKGTDKTNKIFGRSCTKRYHEPSCP